VSAPERVRVLERAGRAVEATVHLVVERVVERVFVFVLVRSRAVGLTGAGAARQTS
jgi:hypothetical protein